MEIAKLRDEWNRSLTAFHLWSAEWELRRADVHALSPEAREARTRNLDRLAAYRTRGLFPRNDHEPFRMAPCFVDGRGTTCAVAHLMQETGAAEAAGELARSQNFHRVLEMKHPALQGWARGAGLTVEELARIQPTYPPTPEKLEFLYRFAALIWGSGVLGMISVMVNLRRSFWPSTPKWSSVCAGVLIGLGLLLVWFICPEGLFAIRRFRGLPTDLEWLLFPGQWLLGPLGLLVLGAAGSRATRDSGDSREGS